jgi:SagB-type dehydrogenase family enzyme
VPDGKHLVMEWSSFPHSPHPGGGPLGGGTPEKVVFAYHERTMHHPRRYAASPPTMDWASQPDPFRRYDGAPLVRLPLLGVGPPPAFWKLYVPGAVAPQPLTKDSLSTFFRYALSLTAWKQFRGTAWALRANPSSGNLHPTEGYAVLPQLEGVADGPAVHHYAPKEHGLERRADLDTAAWSALVADFPPGSFLVGLSSVPWREAWKYGERAFRYCQHDAGHALATLRIAAAALGWQMFLLDGVGDADISHLLGLDREADFAGAEREHPELIAVVTPAQTKESPGFPGELPVEALRLVGAGSWHGKANALSHTHAADWPVIDDVARATDRARHAGIEDDFSRSPPEEELFVPLVRSGSFDVGKVILGRRSAVSMDAKTSIPADTFFRVLARLVPTRDRRCMPWDAIPWRPRIHLGLFVHRVRDVPPGLYALARDPERVEDLRAGIHRPFLWHRPQDCPPGLPFFLLEEGDWQEVAIHVSCGQGIAGDGAFSLAMIADYADAIAAHGAAFYKNLFWEAGVVGQVLYLEAEEAGIRATGIGCYFDEMVHHLFGLSGGWRSLYHFTVGGPVEDLRLTTLPAYGSPDPAHQSR